MHGQHLSPGTTAWEWSQVTALIKATLYTTTRSVQRKLELAKCVKENIIIEFK